ncbi:MAG TPA: translation initiation factor IF-2 [Candidatus Dormibacteraeota bacterium]|nr:translation initiation factor IF-2 [Candidatus Dormibacteraeota bacterium]
MLSWLREHNQPFTHSGAQLPSEVEDQVRKYFEAGGAHVRGIPGRPTQVDLPPRLTVRELADFLKVGPVDIIKDLFKNGIATTINQQIDFETAAIVADNFGVTAVAAEAEQVAAGFGVNGGAESAAEPKSEIFSTEADDPGKLKPRPPVVTVMGHVDHGKTSILDAIRQAKVAAGEAGGITQRVGAYQVEKNGKPITFIDTPGHEAFTAMRARGASITDLAVLVVAADDGVMPQTMEAIQHIKAAGVPMIVALNKIDKDNANPDKVKSELAEKGGVQIEEYGGDVPLVPVSAKEKIGLDDLLEMILLVIEIADLKANPDKLAAGTIIDAHLERGRGPVATVLVQTGTLRVGDPFVIGSINGRVRALLDEDGNKIVQAGPGQPAVVTGLPDVPNAGDILQVVDSERSARAIADQRAEATRKAQVAAAPKQRLEDLYAQLQQGGVKDLNLVVKADSHGSMEALKGSITRIQDPKVRIRVVFEGVGNVGESDVNLAAASEAMVIAFNVRADDKATAAAEAQKVEIRTYDVVYHLTEDVEKAIKGLYEPTFRQVFEGKAEIKVPIKVPKIGFIAGSQVTEGKVSRNSAAKVYRGRDLLVETKISSLRRFKDDVKEVAQGFECGIELEGFQDFQEGDVIESFVLEQENP